MGNTESVIFPYQDKKLIANNKKAFWVTENNGVEVIRLPVNMKAKKHYTYNSPLRKDIPIIIIYPPGRTIIKAEVVDATSFKHTLLPTGSYNKWKKWRTYLPHNPTYVLSYDLYTIEYESEGIKVVKEFQIYDLSNLNYRELANKRDEKFYQSLVKNRTEEFLQSP